MNAKLTKRDAVELEKLKQALIIEWKSSQPPKLDEFFYWWCRKTNNPYVRISKRRKYARILMDLPNASGLLDEEGGGELHDFCVAYGFTEKGNNFRNPDFDHDFPLEDARRFAKKLVQIGLGFCERNQSAKKKQALKIQKLD